MNRARLLLWAWRSLDGWMSMWMWRVEWLEGGKYEGTEVRGEGVDKSGNRNFS